MVNLQVIFLVSETEMIFLMVFTTFEHISSSQFSKVQLKSTVQCAMSNVKYESDIMMLIFHVSHKRNSRVSQLFQVKRKLLGFLDVCMSIK